jgi:hypothetical protein
MSPGWSSPYMAAMAPLLALCFYWPARRLLESRPGPWPPSVRSSRRSSLPRPLGWDQGAGGGACDRGPRCRRADRGRGLLRLAWCPSFRDRPHGAVDGGRVGWPRMGAADPRPRRDRSLVCSRHARDAWPLALAVAFCSTLIVLAAGPGAWLSWRWRVWEPLLRDRRRASEASWCSSTPPRGGRGQGTCRGQPVVITAGIGGRGGIRRTGRTGAGGRRCWRWF